MKRLVDAAKIFIYYEYISLERNLMVKNLYSVSKENKLNNFSLPRLYIDKESNLKLESQRPRAKAWSFETKFL